MQLRLLLLNALDINILELYSNLVYIQKTTTTITKTDRSKQENKLISIIF